MVPETHIHRSSTVNVGQNDEKLRGLLKTTEYCCILSLCEACWGLSHAARQMEKPQLTIVLFLMFVRKKEKNGMCVQGGGRGLCMRVFKLHHETKTTKATEAENTAET